MANGARAIPTAIFLLLALCTAAAAAPGDPIGPAITANPPASSVQDNPAIAASGDGFVVAWSGELPGTTATVHARRFTASGTPVSPFPDIEVADIEKEDNSATAIASNASGQFAVVWSSYTRGEDLESEARIRSFAADGSPLSPVRALQAPGFSGFVPALDVGMSADGNIVAVFSRNETGFRYRAFVRRFAFDASPIDSQAFRIGQRIPGEQGSPHIGVRSDGSFVVSWINRAVIRFAPNFHPWSILNLYFSSIRVQPFAADGTPLRRAVAVDKSLTYLGGLGAETEQSSVAVSDGSGFVVAWTREHASGNGAVVFRPYSASGFPLRLRQTAGRRPAAQRFAPDIAVAANGSFAIVWTSVTALPGVDFEYAVFLRVFDQRGKPLTPATRVSGAADNPALIRNTDPAVAALSNGNFAVTWQHGVPDEPIGPPGSSDVMVQLFEGT